METMDHLNTILGQMLQLVPETCFRPYRRYPFLGRPEAQNIFVLVTVCRHAERSIQFSQKPQGFGL